MKLQLLKAAVPAAIIAIIVMGLSASPAPAQSGFTVKTLVKKGDLLPDGDVFLPCKGCEALIAGQHALNNKGEVTIAADTGGSCLEGRFLISSHSVVRLADFCQQTPWGKLGLLGPVNLNDAGDAAILVGIPGDRRLDAAIITYVGGEFAKIVREFDPTPAGGRFTGCGFGEPSINSNGDVAFFGCVEVEAGPFPDGVFIYSGGVLTKVVASTDPSPIGGKFNLGFVPAQTVVINDNGDVLFRASVILDPFVPEKFGLFLKTDNGIQKIETDQEDLPSGGVVTPLTFGLGDINDNGDVVFSVGISDGDSGSGIFLRSREVVSPIMLEGRPTPLGGSFRTLVNIPTFTVPRINNSRTIAFKNRVKNGTAPAAIFLASPTAMMKVVAVGDKLPTGGKIKDISTFALNDLGEVAFVATVKHGPDGIFLASPVAPEIESIKLKRKKGALELRVNGSAMITNDTVIEINGTPLDELSYPEGFRQNGGLTARVVSRDLRLDQLIQQGQTVQVTVFNSLTNIRSAPVAFTR